jgi:hypothetical protein
MGVPLESSQVCRRSPPHDTWTRPATRYGPLARLEKANLLASIASNRCGVGPVVAEERQHGHPLGHVSQGWDLGQFFSLMYDLGKFFWDSQNQKFVIDSEESVKAMQLHVETPVKEGIETQLDIST